jgi:hypothetical protein
MRFSPVIDDQRLWLLQRRKMVDAQFGVLEEQSVFFQSIRHTSRRQPAGQSGEAFRTGVEQRIRWFVNRTDIPNIRNLRTAQQWIITTISSIFFDGCIARHGCGSAGVYRQFHEFSRLGSIHVAATRALWIVACVTKRIRRPCEQLPKYSEFHLSQQQLSQQRISQQQFSQQRISQQQLSQYRLFKQQLFKSGASVGFICHESIECVSVHRIRRPVWHDKRRSLQQFQRSIWQHSR